MTDNNAVSTLTNNSVSFDISGLRHFEEGDKIWFCLFDIGRMLEMSDSSMRSMKTRDWFDEDEITTVANCNGVLISLMSPNLLFTESSTGLIHQKLARLKDGLPKKSYRLSERLVHIQSPRIRLMWLFIQIILWKDVKL